jgi:hypothetical protein
MFFILLNNTLTIRQCINYVFFARDLSTIVMDLGKIYMSMKIYKKLIPIYKRS